MTIPYYLDLEQLSTAELRHRLETRELLPGHRILRENIAGRFARLDSMGIGNVRELIDALKTKERIDTFSKASGIPVDYLVILSRHARGYEPRPMYLKDIPGAGDLAKLEAAGIKNARQLFERAVTPADRAALAAQTGLSGDVVLELTKISDLARAGYVGPILARLFFEAGADTLAKLAACEPEELYARLKEANGRLKLTKAPFTVKDIALCIETAKELPLVIKY